jgi:hypothetical protein
MDRLASTGLRVIATTLLVALLAASSASPSAAATQVHFKSPSGNINCYVFSSQGGFADCIVRKADWPTLPRRPKACDLDWAATEVELGKTRVSLGQCRGDVGPLCTGAGDPCRVLAYGQAITVGTIRCSSAATGISCRRTTGTRPGFRVAREGVTVFR